MLEELKFLGKSLLTLAWPNKDAWGYYKIYTMLNIFRLISVWETGEHSFRSLRRTILAYFYKDPLCTQYTASHVISFEHLI